MPRILVIDDDEQLRGFLAEVLARAGYEVVCAEHGEEGVQCFKEQPFDLVITDLFMPEKEGCETIMELRGHAPQLRIIAMSGGFRRVDCLPIAKRLGAQMTLQKPVLKKELLDAVSEVLK
jgi:DNA-binding response OmpR family regulator